MKKNAVRDHLHTSHQIQPLGAAITPNSRSSPGTHHMDCPDSVGGREGEGRSFALPPGDFFHRPTRFGSTRTGSPRRCTTGAIIRSGSAVALLLLILLPSGLLKGQSAPRVERTASTTAATPDTTVSQNRPALPTVESLRPDEPVDLALETYLRRDRDDSTLFTSRGRSTAAGLEAGELDSLNPHGKEGDITIPLRGYPAPDDPPRPQKPVYIEGSIGLNTTALLRAGFSGTSWPFDYHGRLDYSSSSGFLENNEESRLSGTLGGGYVIGMNYGIFSGGHMGGEVGYDRRAWRLYALESAPERSLDGWHVEGTSSAGIDRIDLHGTARLRHFSVDQTPRTTETLTPGLSDGVAVDMTSLEGELEATTTTGSILWDGLLDLRLTDAGDASLGFARLDLGTGLDIGILRLRLGGRLGVAEGSDGESVTSLVPTGELRFSPVNGLSLLGRLDGGLHQTTPARLLEINRYATLDGRWLPEEEARGYEVALTVAPSAAWGFRGGASRRTFDSWLHFEASTAGEFRPLYDEATIDRIDADLFVNITSRDRLAAVVAFSEGIRGDGTALPYVPRVDAELFYHRRLFNIPSTAGGSVRFIGERQGSSRTLDPVLLVSLDWSYTVARVFDVVLTARNVLGASWERWEGYQERGFFLSIGARARL